MPQLTENQPHALALSSASSRPQGPSSSHQLMIIPGNVICSASGYCAQQPARVDLHHIERWINWRSSCDCSAACQYRRDCGPSSALSAFLVFLASGTNHYRWHYMDNHFCTTYCAPPLGSSWAAGSSQSIHTQDAGGLLPVPLMIDWPAGASFVMASQCILHMQPVPRPCSCSDLKQSPLLCTLS
ncbi:uncharacterized protein EI90DRAFT_3083259 [Cantharellus anzutake]|uniref:uncharacterized protein n=1 Tax=Cantharellus anzutake TaxID=1750568 RepID=UPI00190308B3|nr:uncharacterized protein EI90DRAFT_3083259 [Cantharellus anzutake]KAF8318620.1 hypothetical protein EI90DRAFT_3083259 [Cantharellus anzutake]